MKIGLDAKRAFHNKTGLGNYSRTIIQALFQLYTNNEYFLITPSKTKNFVSPKNAVVVQPPIYLKMVAPIWRTFLLNKSLKKNNIKIYHGLTNELPYNLDDSISAIVTIHDLIFLRFPHLYPSWDAYIYRKKVKYSCERADKIIAISQQTKEDLMNFLNVPEEKITIIYQDCHPVYHQPVDLKFQAQVKRELNLPTDFILSVGTLEERKNQLLILKALKNLGKSYNLVLVGKSTPYKSVLDQFMRTHNLAGQVVFLENLKLEYLPAIYSLAKVFVYPSIFEGFGIPILEALNMGTPVIAAKGSCLEETGGKYSVYIDPSNERELADAIDNIIKNETYSQKMILEGRNHALTFRKERTTAQLVSIYNQL